MSPIVIYFFWFFNELHVFLQLFTVDLTKVFFHLLNLFSLSFSIVSLSHCFTYVCFLNLSANSICFHSTSFRFILLFLSFINSLGLLPVHYSPPPLPLLTYFNSCTKLRLHTQPLSNWTPSGRFHPPLSHLHNISTAFYLSLSLSYFPHSLCRCLPKYAFRAELDEARFVFRCIPFLSSPNVILPEYYFMSNADDSKRPTTKWDTFNISGGTLAGYCASHSQWMIKDQRMFSFF